MTSLTTQHNDPLFPSPSPPAAEEQDDDDDKEKECGENVEVM